MYSRAELPNSQMRALAARSACLSSTALVALSMGTPASLSMRDTPSKMILGSPISRASPRIQSRTASDRRKRSLERMGAGSGNASTMPDRSLGAETFEHLVGDLEIGVDVLHVVGVFETL